MKVLHAFSCVKSTWNSVHRVRGTTGELKYGIKK